MRGLIEFMPGKLMQSLLASPSPNVHWFGMHCMQFSKIGLELLAGEDTRADDVKQFKKECLSNTILNFYEVTNINCGICDYWQHTNKKGVQILPAKNLNKKSLLYQIIEKD